MKASASLSSRSTTLKVKFFSSLRHGSDPLADRKSLIELKTLTTSILITAIDNLGKNKHRYMLVLLRQILLWACVLESIFSITASQAAVNLPTRMQPRATIKCGPHLAKKNCHKGWSCHLTNRRMKFRLLTKILTLSTSLKSEFKTLRVHPSETR